MNDEKIYGNRGIIPENKVPRYRPDIMKDENQHISFGIDYENSVLKRINGEKIGGNGFKIDKNGDSFRFLYQKITQEMKEGILKYDKNK